MTATELVFPVMSAILGFIVPLSIILLGFSLLHMIGKTN